MKRYALLIKDICEAPDGAWIRHKEISAIFSDLSAKRLSDLKALAERLQDRQFCLHYDDYILLKRSLPSLLRIIREAGGG